MVCLYDKVLDDGFKFVNRFREYLTIINYCGKHLLKLLEKNN